MNELRAGVAAQEIENLAGEQVKLSLKCKMLPEREEYLLRIFARCYHIHHGTERIPDGILCRNDRTHRFGLRVVAREQVARRRVAHQGSSLDQARTSCPVSIGFGRRVLDHPA